MRASPVAAALSCSPSLNPVVRLSLHPHPFRSIIALVGVRPLNCGSVPRACRNTGAEGVLCTPSQDPAEGHLVSPETAHPRLTRQQRNIPSIAGTLRVFYHALQLFTPPPFTYPRHIRARLWMSDHRLRPRPPRPPFPTLLRHLDLTILFIPFIFIECSPISPTVHRDERLLRPALRPPATTPRSPALMDPFAVAATPHRLRVGFRTVQSEGSAGADTTTIHPSTPTRLMTNLRLRYDFDNLLPRRSLYGLAPCSFLLASWHWISMHWRLLGAVQPLPLPIRSLSHRLPLRARKPVELDSARHTPQNAALRHCA